jgi:hypothetical protein
MTLFPCKFVYSALLGLDSTFPKLDKNVAKKISHATQHWQAHLLLAGRSLHMGWRRKCILHVQYGRDYNDDKHDPTTHNDFNNSDAGDNNHYPSADNYYHAANDQYVDK